ncbi:hypothetical protein EVAR_11096_1 [Eumeta japonica]|uniref:Uncharacterized protein n=1 Tax=Eumeta variegata TaxID=151549 RepID=A0A4C1U3V0_EUMVA|nr:hypothetical protein EVAR_11096_1 [Eumeta japonica]
MASQKNLAIDKSDEISGLALKPPISSINSMMQPQVMPVTTHFSPMAGLPPPYDKAAQMHSLSKTVFPQPLMMPGPGMSGFPREMNGQLSSSFGLTMGRQGPTKDVKSIIADYRQRNPDMNPRRGRRMKSILNPNMMNPTRQMAPKIDNLNNLGMMFNNLDMNQKAMLERLTQLQAGGLANGLAFKDVLVQFANMQQQQAGLHNIRPPAENVSSSRPEAHIRHENRNRRQERQMAHSDDVHAATKTSDSQSPRLPPPPYPEISLLPVGAAAQPDPPQQNSLLHGILTKPLPANHDQSGIDVPPIDARALITFWVC